jgi:hypothetical protein
MAAKAGAGNLGARNSGVGYSGTPLLQKLGIKLDAKAGQRVLVCNPPAGLPDELKGFAAERRTGKLDVALLFASSEAVFKAEFGKLMQDLDPSGAIWVAWPKKTSGVRSDLTDCVIRDYALTLPFVDVKVCAIDETWSGLKLVVRKELRNSFANGTYS